MQAERQTDKQTNSVTDFVSLPEGETKKLNMPPGGMNTTTANQPQCSYISQLLPEYITRHVYMRLVTVNKLIIILLISYTEHRQTNNHVSNLMH